MPISKVEVVTLSDNIAGRGFKAEWGLSLLIEAEGRRILFDTGASDIAVKNAHTAGIKLDGVDTIVLSHAHADHTGGLLAVLNETGMVNIIAHPDIREAKYACRHGEQSRCIGLPFSLEELESAGARFHLSRDSVEIAPGIITSGEIPMVSEFEKIDESLLVEKSGVMHGDRLADDLALIVKTHAGLVVVLGCAHRGVVNTLLHASKLTGVSCILAVIGGMHLWNACEEQVSATVAALKAMHIEHIVASHFTGSLASRRLAQEFGGRFSDNCTGSKFTWP